MFMSDIFEIIIRYFFENNRGNDNPTLKKIVITILKIMLFFLILSVGVWLAITLKNQKPWLAQKKFNYYQPQTINQQLNSSTTNN